MEDRDFNAQSEAIVRRLLPWIPQKYVDGFEGTLVGGEYEIAVEDLAYTLVDDQVPVDPEERDLLYRLVRDMKDHEVLLTKLDGLAVQDEHRP